MRRDEDGRDDVISVGRASIKEGMDILLNLDMQPAGDANSDLLISKVAAGRTRYHTGKERQIDCS